MVSSYSFAYRLQVSPFFAAPCGSLLEGLGWKQAISNTSREGDPSDSWSSLTGRPGNTERREALVL
jgi:hypothetical protein